MRDRLLLPMFVFLSLLSLGSFAQEGSAENFDPRDLSGVWYGSGGGGGDVSFGPDMPQLRAEGEAVYLTRIPTHSVDPRVPAVDNPALSNDPTFTCNPRGFPRVIFDTAPRTFEFVHIHNRLLQLHQRGRTLREFWLDGREVPTPENMDNIGPSWYGHSVADWQNDSRFSASMECSQALRILCARR